MWLNRIVAIGVNPSRSTAPDSSWAGIRHGIALAPPAPAGVSFGPPIIHPDRARRPSGHHGPVAVVVPGDESEDPVPWSGHRTAVGWSWAPTGNAVPGRPGRLRPGMLYPVPPLTASSPDRRLDRAVRAGRPTDGDDTDTAQESRVPGVLDGEHRLKGRDFWL